MKLWKRLVMTAAVAALCLTVGVSALAVERYQVMMYGDKDEYVLRLQKELIARGYMSGEATGYYGDATVAAVKKLQEKKSLEVDGIAGIATQKALFGKYYAEIPSSRTVNNTKTSSESTSSSTSSSASSSSSSSSSTKRYQVMMYGDKDEYVLRLQKELIARGYMSGEATGYYGDATEAAVINFQKKKGLEADGIAGVATQKALFGKYYEPIPSTRAVKGNSTTADEDTSAEDEKFDSMRRGDAGSVVKKVQEQLKELGYFTQSKTTTYFGEVTEEAVLAFQKRNGLKEDGVVGIKTYTLLFSGNAKKAATGSASSSSSSATEKTEEVDLGVTGNSEVIEAAIRFAGEQLGKRYVYGGKGPDTFDCSGFTSYVLKHVDITITGSSKVQGNNSAWPKISYENLQRGDLLIFTGTNLSGIGHVGIYLGDGRFIHCSSGSAMSVTISHLADRYMDRFLWGRRWAVDADAKVAEETRADLAEEEQAEGSVEAETPVEEFSPMEENIPEEDVLIEDEE